MTINKDYFFKIHKSMGKNGQVQVHVLGVVSISYKSGRKLTQFHVCSWINSLSLEYGLTIEERLLCYV